MGALGRRMVQQLLRSQEGTLRKYLQKFLNSLIMGRSNESDLQEDYHTLIHEVPP